ncbi:hypothetical protein [Marivita lacus]|uniref:hypothetical protein n=1 Tax=Marivita lacus TaxID=1323742 RepID=UPI0016630BFD|nr:hypothetical protein [Marivita lacus]
MNASVLGSKKRLTIEALPAIVITAPFIQNAFVVVDTSKQRIEERPIASFRTTKLNFVLMSGDKVDLKPVYIVAKGTQAAQRRNSRSGVAVIRAGLEKTGIIWIFFHGRFIRLLKFRLLKSRLKTKGGT